MRLALGVFSKNGMLSCVANRNVCVCDEPCAVMRGCCSRRAGTASRPPAKGRQADGRGCGMSCKAVAEVWGGGQAQGPDGEAYESEHQSSASIVVCCSIPMWIGCFNRRLLFSWLFVIIFKRVLLCLPWWSHAERFPMLDWVDYNTTVWPQLNSWAWHCMTIQRLCNDLHNCITTKG